MSPRLNSIEYMRGIGMIGVVAIHIGSQYLVANPTPNTALLALYEIFTRFAVPIFFFISAFGLFYNLDFSKPFSYKNFYKKRWQTVALPYFIWSLFYLCIYAFFYHQWGALNPFNIIYNLFWGLASYQLYFMVILLWFYLFFPLWLKIVPKLNMKSLAIIFICQLIFNYYSSYCINVYTLQDTIFKPFIAYRLNYLILHYLFIFLLGGYMAIHYPKLRLHLKNNLNKLRLSALVGFSLLLSHYYYCLYQLNYSPESAINTAHQLSPAGLVYTLAMSIYLLAECEDGWLSKHFTSLQHQWGKHSYFIYLVHPLIIILVKDFYGKFNLVMTGINSIIFFLLVVFISMYLGKVVRSLSQKYCPRFNALTIGIYPKKNS